jgi:Fe-S-cluster-containing hydrogenase component 2
MKDVQKTQGFLDRPTGVVTESILKDLPGFPGINRLGSKPVAILECDQEIPCNPCEDICPNKAISVGSPITNLPVIDPSRCNGCLNCIRVCPGLCIFVIIKDYSGDSSLVYIPYEFLDIPDKDEEVTVLDRYGRDICRGRVIKVMKKDKKYRTAVIAIQVPKRFVNSARHLKRLL